MLPNYEMEPYKIKFPAKDHTIFAISGRLSTKFLVKYIYNTEI